MRKATIVFNPVARKAPPPQRLRLAPAALRPDGWEIDVCPTTGPLHAIELARGAANAGAEVVFACGGDGTVNEVVNGLAGTEAALGIVRAGTGNVFGKEVRVPRGLNDALRVLIDGEDYRFDLGLAGARRFLLMAGIGFDGSIVRRVPPGPKRLLGTTSYVLWGAAEALRFQAKAVTLSIDGDAHEIDLYWLLLGNTRSYGGVVDITHRAVADDGLLDTYVFAGSGLPWMLKTGARIALRRHDAADGVSFYRARAVEVLSPGLHVQADGEYFGPTPMSFSVLPGALKVRLPRGAAHRLMSTT